MQCADMYLSFEVNTLKVKSSRHIEMNYENKKARAVGLAELIMNQCVILYNNLQSVVKVDKMCRLRDNFFLHLRNFQQSWVSMRCHAINTLSC